MFCIHQNEIFKNIIKNTNVKTSKSSQDKRKPLLTLLLLLNHQTPKTNSKITCAFRFPPVQVRLEFSAKLGSKMEKNGPSWGEVGSKLHPRVAKMLPRWPAWSLFRGFGRISVQCWLIFGVVFAAGWEVAQSMKTNNTPSLLLDFHGLGGYFSAALGKVGASGGVLWALGGLVDDLVGIFGEAW